MTKKRAERDNTSQNNESLGSKNSGAERKDIWKRKTNTPDRAPRPRKPREGAQDKAPKEEYGSRTPGPASREKREERREARPQYGRPDAYEDYGPGQRKKTAPYKDTDRTERKRPARREEEGAAKRTFPQDKRQRSQPKTGRPAGNRAKPGGSRPKPTDAATANDGLQRLNKYIANAGVCSRRAADELIAAGKVKVNGNTVTEMGHKLQRGDSVTVDGKPLKGEKHVYVLLNKPKGFITTTSDPENRKTVMDLVSNAGDERIFPVGRLDRNTSGVLLLTNDGDLANELMHPSKNVSKIYRATLNKNINSEDLNKLVNGIELEDGMARADEAALVDPRYLNEIGIEIHSGKNRIVRRMFEALGYEVEKLDRVAFSILTKKDLPRGKWRFLSEKEVRMLRQNRG